MINLAISLTLGLVVFAAVRLGGFPIYAGAIPATIVFLGTFVVLGRRTFTQVQKLMTTVQNDLQSIPPNAKERKVRIDKVVKMLEAGLPLGRWQFLVESQIHGQIGMLKYLFEDYEGAKLAFAKASSRDYYVKAMEGALAFKKKDFPAMQQSFEAAVTHGKKEGLMWAAYAWCLLQNKEKDKEVTTMSMEVTDLKVTTLDKALFEIAQFALGAPPRQRAPLQRRHARAVVAAIFEAPERVDDIASDRLVTENADDSAHGSFSLAAIRPMFSILN